MATTSTYFTPATFRFLTDLARNNNRPWFEMNKHRYEGDVKDPALRFIEDFGPQLKKISTNFRADPRPVGGSLFRIYRDTRFSKDKSPYKTAAGVHFRHFESENPHAPGFYLHIAPRNVFLGVGIWRPDPKTAAKIRQAIAEDPKGWSSAVRAKAFRDRFQLEGESLARPPRGFDKDHPLIEDLKRKDFIGVAHLDEKSLTAPGFMKDFTALCRAGGGVNRFLCEAIGIPY
jgi:uncharacterized protein (TIGR02453 family)